MSIRETASYQQSALKKCNMIDLLCLPVVVTPVIALIFQGVLFVLALMKDCEDGCYVEECP